MPKRKISELIFETKNQWLGVTDVSYTTKGRAGKRFDAHIYMSRQHNKYIGTYNTAIEAALAYDAAVIELGYSGVYLQTRGRKYTALIRVDGFQEYIGLYDTSEEAAKRRPKKTNELS